MGIRGAISAVAGSTLLAAVGVVVAPAPALAYTNCNKIVATASLTPGTAIGLGQVTFAVELTNCTKGSGQGGDGSPAANQVVNFSQQSGPANCQVTFSSPTATTDAMGHASVTVTLPPNCPGTYTLLANGAGFSVQASVIEKGVKGASFLSNDPSQQQPIPVLPLLVIGAGLALLAAGGAGLIRRPRSKSS
jgi:hypothetical protein